MWISYNFKAALDYGSLYESIYFWCQDTTLKNIFNRKVQFSLEWANQLMICKHLEEWMIHFSGKSMAGIVSGINDNFEKCVT